MEDRCRLLLSLGEGLPNSGLLHAQGSGALRQEVTKHTCQNAHGCGRTCSPVQRSLSPQLGTSPGLLFSEGRANRGILEIRTALVEAALQIGNGAFLETLLAQISCSCS